MDTQQLLEAAQTIDILRSMFADEKNEWLPVIAAIGGAFVGGVSTFFPSFLLEKRKLRQEKRSVEIAIVSEISALLEVIERRKYVHDLKEDIDYLKQNPDDKIQFAAQVPAHYSQVYQEHISKIGLLHPELSARIIRFHQLIDSVVQDISTDGFVAGAGGDLETLEELHEILDSAVHVGRKIVGGEVSPKR
ncbi:hypothetical protein NJR55_10625 [Idiomarina sp. M1R2S28]|uniref:Uncharacterized protein n=1 Tax=Idiomarina rhizosphaerae TaxID=2961572 RepID=A0A9X2G520_9GAMM|nr:hypothetical protein [Idiomarina rhizosphaerae]MCP1340038.1 hypothetical protein [Idiomarina rhizosphaerae]